MKRVSLVVVMVTLVLLVVEAQGGQVRDSIITAADGLVDAQIVTGPPQMGYWPGESG